ICAGNSTTLTASGGSSYSWNNGATTSSIVVSPTINTSYYVIGSLSSVCFDTAFTLVHISNTFLDPGNSGSICSGDTTQLAAGGNAVSYSWSPSNSLSNSSIASPIAYPSVTTTYTVTGTNAFGCIGIDSETVFVLPPAIV